MGNARICVMAETEATLNILDEFSRAAGCAVEHRILSGAAAPTALPPDVDAIVSCAESGDDAWFSHVGALNAENPFVPMLMLVRDPTPAVMDRAMECAVRRVKSFPIGKDDYCRALDEIIAQERRRFAVSGDKQGKNGMVVSVFSTKGGTGKTTVAVNCAAALALKGKSVVIVDLDLQFGDVDLFLDLPRNETISQVIEGGNFSLPAVRACLTMHKSRLAVLMAPKSPEYADMVKPEHVEAILQSLRQGFDYIVIDMPPAFNDTVLSALEQSDSILFVTNPDISTLRNTKICNDVLHSLNLEDKAQLVINKNGYSAITAKEVTQVLGMSPVGVIPNDPKTACKAINTGIAIVCSNEKVSIAAALRELAQKLRAEPDGKKTDVRKREEAKAV